MKMMRKLILSVFAFVFIFVCFASIQFNNEVDAGTVVTSDKIVALGAGVRLTDKPGIRFAGSVGSYDTSNVKAYGFLIAYGEKAVGDTFIHGETNGGKSLLVGEDNSLDAQGRFYITLYNIPETGYVQNVTARPYVKLNDDSYVYGETISTRNLTEVSLKALNDGYTADILSTVATSVGTNCFKVTSKTIEDKYLILSDSRYEVEISKLAEEFIKDWNTKFESSLDASTCFTTVSGKTPFGTVAQGTLDGQATGKLFEFFADSTYKAKWDWILEYIKGELYSSGNCYDEATLALNCDSSSNKNWNKGYDLIATICGLFTEKKQTHNTDGYAFSDKKVLLEIVKYNDQVYADLTGVTLTKKDSFVLTDLATEGYSCTYISYPENDPFTTGIELDLSAYSYYFFKVIISANTYTITYKDGESIVKTDTYSYDKPKVLYAYEKEGYDFEGWYDNALFTSNVVTTIAINSTGDKTFYAKTKLAEKVNVNVSFNLNGGYIPFANMLAEQQKSPFTCNGYEGGDDSLITGIKLIVPGMYGGYSDSTSYYKVLAARSAVGLYTVLDISTPNDSETINTFADPNVYPADEEDYFEYVIFAATSTYSSAISNIKVGDYLGCDLSEYTGEGSFTVTPYSQWGPITLKETITLPIPSNQDSSLEFKGWYDNAEFKGTAITSFPGYTSAQDPITYYAKWETKTN